MRRYVVGDIHGGYLALVNVLEQVNFDYENDQLISLGDLCDGWSQTPEVIEELMKIKNLVYVKGNHDDWTVKYLNKPIQFSDNYMNSWLHHGGRSTREAYEKLSEETKEKHLEFLRNAFPFYIDEENNLFIHAGYHENYVPGVKDWSNNEYVMEDYFWNRDFWQAAYKGRTVGKEFNHVYIGHTPTLNFPNSNLEHFKPMNRGNVTNMDTGACFTGKLSMMNLETKEIIQSDTRVMEFYPYEFGRNQTAFARMK